MRAPRLLDCLETVDGYRSSRLYEHMQFKEIEPETYQKLREKLEEAFAEMG